MGILGGINVTVYEKDSEGNRQETLLEKHPNGQGRVPPGTQLYCFGGSEGSIASHVMENIDCILSTVRRK